MFIFFKVLCGTSYMSKIWLFHKEDKSLIFKGYFPNNFSNGDTQSVKLSFEFGTVDSNAIYSDDVALKEA